MLYVGVVENRYDPMKLGRCQVRVVGLHTHNRNELPTADLPWAMAMQPVTSAALSGIGTTPVGPVEGTWVIVMFNDESNQIPIMLGTFGGIPQRDFADITSSNDTLTLKLDGLETKTNQQSGVLVDSSGEPVVDGSGQPVAAGDVVQSIESNTLKRAADFNVSKGAIDVIKQYEGLRLTAYQDSVGIWTIGYGTTMINGRPVVQGMTIGKEDAELYLQSHVDEVVKPTLKRNVRALITQSMFDALASFAYNVGTGALSKSTLLKDLNSSKYLDSAAGFMQWTKAGGVELAGLVRRRKAEKDLFLKDGLPNDAGEVTPNQQQELPQDVQNAQQANPAAGNTSNATASKQVVIGFSDPSGKYPLYYSEPDTNRLGRHEEIQKTVVYKKEASLDKGVEIAGGGTWDQSPVPYNAQYPFNHVMQSESGHVLEFDDTPNSERVHIYHKSGTFTEIDANGTQVNRIVGDGYTIIERNGFVHIQGTLNVTVEGAQNVLIKNGMNLDVYGTTNINVYNDVNLNVSGSMNASIGSNFNVKAAAIKLEADSIDMFSNGGVNIQAAGETNILSGGNINLEAPQIHGANGASGAATTGLGDAPAAKEVSVPEFNQLTVITRESQAAGQYETPDEGDPTAYQQRQIQTGAINQENLNSGEQQAAEAPPTNAVQPAGAKCDAIFKMTSFDVAMPLSKNFTLSALTKKGSRMPVAQLGLTPQEIVCNLKGLCENVLEVVHDYYPNMIITSGFRRPGDIPQSSKTSDHYNGQAVDIVIPNLDRAGHYEAIKKLQTLLPYDQLILEYSGAKTVWIHFSFKYTNGRKQVFTMRDHHRIGNMGQLVLVT
jgi:GH24 family phage-related lysozyme (muramidase)